MSKGVAAAIVALVVVALAGVTSSRAGLQSPERAFAACAQWNVTGTWTTVQSNVYRVTWRFTQNGTKITGTATLPPAEASRAGYTGNVGKVTGTLVGARLSVVVEWPPRPDGSITRGRYVGTVTAGRVANGQAWDLANPSAKASWTGAGTAKCGGGGTEKVVHVDFKYHLMRIVPVNSPSCKKTPNPLDQDWPGEIGPNHGEARVQFTESKEYGPHHVVFTGGTITSGGDFQDGHVAFDLDEKGRRIFPTARCRGTTLKLRMVKGTQTFEVTPKTRIFTTRVQVLSADGFRGDTCGKSTATLRLVDSDVRLVGFDADAMALIGWAPACPHAFSYSMTAPTATLLGVPPGATSWGTVYVALRCDPPPGAPGGISPRSC